MNSLEHASSSYLRSAMHQPVQWMEWGEAAFTRAAREDKPVLLDIGAVWCHWCHVMDRESYEDTALAAVINELFVPIKVDRDERPDVDSRYQAAVSAISGQGGWPLTAILTPDGRPYFGGTYFPREDRYGRPGFERVLRTLADVWRNRREEALDSAASVLAAIEHGETFSGRVGLLEPGLTERLVANALAQFDSRFGGFGTQPKFPHPAALDLLLDHATRTGDEAARKAAVFTLEQMAKGGVYDQLAGGFHRYSVDERWVVPHFEKLLYDNAGLLANYVHAFQSFAEPQSAAMALDILRWMDTVLSDRERGGFYASQDADIHLEDDGDYFTWTREEAAAALTAEEMAVAELYFDLGEIGDMHHNPAKNVLRVAMGPELVAQRLGRTREQVQQEISAARGKLLAARLARRAPFVDRTIYTGWNAMAVSAYLAASNVLQLPAARAFALRTLDRMLREGYRGREDGRLELAHVIAYPDGAAPRVRAAAGLDDYALLAHAALDAWEATGEPRYYRAAEQLVRTLVARFHDVAGGGFFDTEPGAAPLGALSARRKPLQDSPTPAGNPAAAAALLRVYAWNGDGALHEIAKGTLESFAGIVEHLGLYAGAYGLALNRLLLPPVQVVVLGEDERAERLAALATSGYAANKSVVRLKRSQVSAENLPPVLAETLPALPQLAKAESFAVVCRSQSCLPPTSSPQTLTETLTEAMKKGTE